MELLIKKNVYFLTQYNTHTLFLFYKNNFIRTPGWDFAQIWGKIKNNLRTMPGWSFELFIYFSRTIRQEWLGNGEITYFNSVLKEYCVSFTDGSEDYIQITDIDGVGLQLV